MKKDIYRVFSSNLIKMVVTFLSAFIVPMVLSVTGYGYLKSYQFYASYIGITHLGFCDGVYLFYGGKNERDLDKNNISVQWSSLLLYEIIIAILFILLGITRRNLIIICVGATIVPNVIFTFYSYIFQAVGDFANYTLIVNIYSIINMLINLILVLLKVRDYRLYMVLYVFIEIVPFIVGTCLFFKKDWISFTLFDRKIFINFVKAGILLMIGNFAYSIFIGIDKWFIKFTLPIRDFSMFSFASQMLTVVNMFITPIAMTLYSNISKRQDFYFEIQIKKILICILMIIPLAIYILKFIIYHFMTRYIQAVNITSILLITQIFLSLNVAIFVNLYKAYKKQKEYFIRLMVSLVVAIVIDIIIVFIKPNTMSFAFSTMISCFIWLLLNLKYFPYMQPEKKEKVYVFGLLLIYLLTLYIDNIFLKFVIYLLSYLLMTKQLMPEQWKYFTKYVKRYL